MGSPEAIAPTMTRPALLGDLIRDGKLLWLYCRECHRERDVDPATIPLPPDVPVPEIGKRMKCSACGSRKIDSRPDCIWAELKRSEAAAVSKLLVQRTCRRTASKIAE
jgi:hypothetical protein